MIITDVAWRENYSSSAFNRKFKGVIQPGIYGGFDVVVGVGEVTITSDNSSAIANISNSASKLIDGLGEYLVSVHMTQDVTLPVPVGAHSLIIRANYGIDEDTTTEFLFVESPNQNDLVLCTINMLSVGSEIVVDYSKRATMSVASEDFAVDRANELAERSKDVTGFPDRLHSKLSFDDATRTVTIDPVEGDTFQVFYRNRKLDLSSKSIQVENVSGGRYINIDPLTSELIEGEQFPDTEEDFLAAYVYYNAEQGKFVIKGDERHSSSRDTTWHAYAHRDNGMLWLSGGSLAYTAKDDTQVTVGLGTPLLTADEDIRHNIIHSLTPSSDFEQVLEGEALIPVIYVDADGYYRQDEATNMPYKMGSARVAYNSISHTGKGSQADVPSGKYVNYFIIATNCIEQPIKAIQGRMVFDTAEEAQNEKIDSYGLQLAEVAALYQVALHVDDTYSNPMKVRIEQVFFPEQRKEGGIPAIGANLHEGLGGRSQPNQHPIGAITGLRAELDSKVEDAKLEAVAKGYTKQLQDDLVQKSPSILVVDQLRRSVEAESGGKQTVIYTAKKQPCIMNVIPRFLMEDLPGWDTEDGTGTHPAFIFNGVVESEIFIGAYQASEVAGEAISQPMAYPRVNINYDQARAMCQANGAGWDMMSNWDWAAVALWCMANGFQPRGNTNYGRHHDSRHETGRVPAGATIGSDATGVTNTLTGSGPNTWRHDNSPSGISDLVGNVWEWQTGFKLLDGVALIAPDNGTYTEAQYTNAGFSLGANGTFATRPNTGAPDILKQGLIVPNGAADPDGYFYITADGERLPLRGGFRVNAGGAGLGALGLSGVRTNAGSDVGFRPRFRNP